VSTCPTDTAGIQKAILVPRCGKSGCHVGEDPAQGLDLVSPGLESRVDDVIGACGRPIVTPGQPNESYLITKVSRRNPSCGSGMPFDGTVLSAHDVACLTSWVTHLGPPPPTDAGTETPATVPDASFEGGTPPAGRDGGPVVKPPPPPCADGKMRCGALCITAIQPTFDSIYASIIARSCVFDSCHGGTAPKEHLGMATADDAYANLVGVKSAQRPELLRVDPTHPDSSYVVDKLLGQNLGIVTTTNEPSQAMPQPPSKPLCDAKISVIEAWIQSGAAR
jgi:hypothetical protein